jgi:CDP-glucose 4,6-dehydratase
VIGGGDVSKDRLLPDLLRRFGAGETVEIRYPDAVRPWQHVLDCLNGYLAILDALLVGRGAGSWNIGPDVESFVPVRTIADRVVELWGGPAAWQHVNAGEPHEANLLALDARRAQVELGWRNRLDLDTSLQWTVSWERSRLAGADPGELSRAQILHFEGLAPGQETSRLS